MVQKIVVEKETYYGVVLFDATQRGSMCSTYFKTEPCFQWNEKGLGDTFCQLNSTKPQTPYSVGKEAQYSVRVCQSQEDNVVFSI